jgi:hypothetical protein
MGGNPAAQMFKENLMSNVQYRKFCVVDPATRVLPSRMADWLLCFAAEGAKVFRWDDNAGYFTREMDIPVLEEGTVGAFRHDQFYGTFEVAIVCGDQIRRFDLKSKQELQPIMVSGASALVYDMSGNVLIVGTQAGMVKTFSLVGNAPSLLLTEPVCSREIIQMVPAAANAIALFSESGECVQFELTTGLSIPVEGVSGSAVFAQSLDSPEYALAIDGGVLEVGNWETGDTHTLMLGHKITHLCFLSPVRLAVSMTKSWTNSLCIVHLDRLDSPEPPTTSGRSDGLMFDNGSRFENGQLVGIPSALDTQLSEPQYIEPVFLQYTERVHGLHCDDDGLVVVFE